MAPLVPASVAALAGGLAAWRLARLARDVRRARRLAAGVVAYQRHLAEDGPALLVVGDSLSVGVGASAPEHSVAGRIATECPGLTVVNVARTGARLGEIPAQLRDAPSRRWSAVLLVAGGNDAIGRTPASVARRDARRAVAAACRLAPRVVVVASPNVGAAPIFPWPLTWLLEARSRTVRDAVGDACAAHGAAFVDFFRPLDADPFARDPGRWFGDDGVHPSSDCYGLCFQLIERRTGLAAGLAAAGC